MSRVLVDGIMYRLQAQGGITRCFDELLARVGRYDNELEILFHLPARYRRTPPRAPWLRTIRDRRIRPHRFFGPIMRRASMARLRTLKPRVFHSTYYTRPYWPGMQSVVTVHDFAHQRFPELMTDMDHELPSRMKRAIEEASAIIAVSETVRGQVLEYTRAEPSRTVVIPHGIGDAFKPNDSDPGKIGRVLDKHGVRRPYWLHVGRREGYKNFMALMRAFVARAGHEDAALVAVGGAPELEPEPARLVAEHRLDARVHVLHGVSDEELRLLYADATALVFPSFDEGFGIPLLEAMACGTVSIASDIPAFREVAGRAALYFDPHAWHALSEHMRRVAEDEAVRDDLIRAGRERVQEFSWDVSARALAEVYRGLG